jgi:hypothetical protein
MEYIVGFYNVSHTGRVTVYFTGQRGATAEVAISIIPSHYLTP